MIVLDTHIWAWWVHDDARLPEDYRDYLQRHESEEFGVSAISCWEVAKLVEYGRFTISLDIVEWFDQALADSGIRLLEITPTIAIESTRLPGTFHRADHRSHGTGQQLPARYPGCVDSRLSSC